MQSGTNRKDDLFNALLSEWSNRNLIFDKTSAQEEGTYITQVSNIKYCDNLITYAFYSPLNPRRRSFNLGQQNFA